MKKVVYLIILMVSIVLFNISCETPENVTPVSPVGIQPIDLIGDWSFVSLEFNGMLYTDCDEVLNKNYDLVTMGIKDVTTTHMTFYSNCIDGITPFSENFSYTLKDNVITDENRVKYEILNTTSFNGTQLKLKLIDQAYNTDLPINGIYTLNKE